MATQARPLNLPFTWRSLWPFRRPSHALVPATPPLLPMGAGALDLLSIAIRNNAAIDVIERLTALQERMLDRKAKIEFDEALNRCQTKLRRIAADATNPSTSSMYASYAKLDSVIRPIYTGEGFSVSFGEKDCPNPTKTRFVAYLSRYGVTREYLKDMTPSVNGPKGAPVMTQTHAEGAVDSYAKRYLVKDIFNVAVGEGDTDGNTPTATGLANSVNKDFLRAIQKAANREQLTEAFTAAYRSTNDKKAREVYITAKDTRIKELR